MQFSNIKPSLNSLVERGVQTFKRGFHKLFERTVEDHMSRFLLQYRIIPHTATDHPPAKLLFGQNLRSRLDLIKPDLAKSVDNRQHKQKENHGQKSPSQTFEVRDKVYVRNFRDGNTWVPGYLLQAFGPCSFMAKLLDGHVIQCHTDHLRLRTVDFEVSAKKNGDDAYLWCDPGPESCRTPEQVNTPETAGSENIPREPEPRYSSRIHRPLERYDPS